jgi:SagB-type dehydrogenase family enzyme
MKKINKIPQFKLTLSQDFHEKTKISPENHIKSLPVSKWPDDWKKVYFKGYPRFKGIDLPNPKLATGISYKKTLFKRSSFRDFSKKPMDKTTLSSLLYYAAGLREHNPTQTANRFYPSAGGRYTLEVYPVIFNVKGVDPGIYHYYLKGHLLEALPKKKNFQSKSFSYFGDQPWVEDANLLIVISAVFFRNKVKYYDRGYRHVLTEVGSLIQTIYLTCTALGIGCCPTGGYKDDGYNSLLDLDGTEESVIGVVAVGLKK